MFFSFQKRIKLLAMIVCMVSVTLAGILAILSSPTKIVTAEPVPLLNAGLGVATIDGYVNPTEWATAARYTSIMYSSIPQISGTLYVMQDFNNLYFGFTLADDEFTINPASLSEIYGDTLEFKFDDDNSGVLNEVGENKVTVFPITPFVRDGYIIDVIGTSVSDTFAVGGKNNGIGMVARHADLNHFELSFPICSGDAYDFCFGPRSLFGVNLKYIDLYPVADRFDHDDYTFPYGVNASIVQIQLLDWSQIYLPLVQR